MKTLIFDTETTSLISNSILPLNKQPRVIELFALVLEDGIETNSFHFLFNIEELLSPEVTKITGITDKDLDGQPKFAERYEWIGSLFELHDEVVAHNLGFDKAMIDMEMLRCGLRLKWPRKICTVEATEYMLGYRLGLTALHELLFKEPFEGAHRAENDVRALARCFIELRRRQIV